VGGVGASGLVEFDAIIATKDQNGLEVTPLEDVLLDGGGSFKAAKEKEWAERKKEKKTNPESCSEVPRFKFFTPP
jgi:hypothetical protein